MRKLSIIYAIMFLYSTNLYAEAENVLRVFSWDGYVTDRDIKAVDELLKQAGSKYHVSLIKPFAQGPEQMFNIIRKDECDISFLTLNYIKMDKAKTQSLLQPLDVSRLKNYQFVRPELKAIELGLDENKKPYYSPFGGGSYGIWANMNRYKESDLPKSLSDLLNPKWKKKIHLTDGQVQPNIAMAFMSVDKMSPWVIHDKMEANDRNGAISAASADSPAQQFLNKLYQNVDTFWADAPIVSDPKNSDLLVASYGPEVASWNANGGKWQLIPVIENYTVWLDTINILKSVKDPEKLKAAYIFIDYFLSPAVQDRVVEGLSMVAVTTNTKSNPLIEKNPNFFDAKLFWPAYSTSTSNSMRDMHNRAIAEAKK